MSVSYQSDSRPEIQMRKAAADAWLDCGSKLILNKAAAAIRAAIAASPAAPAAPVPDALVEAVAKAIYWEWRRDAGYVPWVDGGNSLKQDDARKIARAVVSSAAPVVPQPFTKAQLHRLYVNSPELHKDAPSEAAFTRIVQLAEQAHGIGGGNG